jgi:hypothetical protein
MTGKPRTFFSTDTYANGWQLINGLWYFASHDHTAYQPSPNESIRPQYAAGPWRPISLCGGYATPGSYGGGVGHQTGSLNHVTHKNCLIPTELSAPGYTGDPSILKHHEWIHVAYCWDMSGTSVHLMTNGIAWTNSNPEVLIHPQPTQAEDWTSENAIFRLGEPSSTMSYGGSRNWTVDGTIDEFYMWKGNALETAAQVFDRGRYHVPRFGQEGVFTSQPILEHAIHGQKLADPSPVRPPIRRHNDVETGVAGSSPPPRRQDGGGNRTTTSGPMEDNRPPDMVRPICAFWTWYPEYTDSEGVPLMTDRLEHDRMRVEVKFSMLLDGDDVGEVLTLDGGSPIERVSVKKGQKLQYRLKVLIPESVGGTLLTTTPVIDDVTIFYTRGVEYIHYNRLDDIEP